MSQRFLLTLAACLPIALSGCSGGGGGASLSPATQQPENGGGSSSPATQQPENGGASQSEPTEEADLLEEFENYQRRVTDLTVTHVEMTDQIIRAGGRTEIVCSDSVSQTGQLRAGCSSSAAGQTAPISVLLSVNQLQGASDLSSGFSSLGGRINLIELAVKRTAGSSTGIIGGVGRYSAFSTSRIYDTDGSFGRAVSTAFGERTAMRPSEVLPSETFGATWRGAMVGTSISDSGPALAGEVVLTYSVADNEVDVDISNVRSYDDVSYTGPSSFSWSDLQVQSDGEFHLAGSQNNHISGSFYGSKTDEFWQGAVEGAVSESAGVFEHNSVIGAWLALLRETASANPTGGVPATDAVGVPATGGTPDGGLPAN